MLSKLRVSRHRPALTRVVLTIRRYTLSTFLSFLALTLYADVQSAVAQTLTPTVESGTSTTYPAGYNADGNLPPSDTADPLGPFSGHSVAFTGSSTRVFRYRLSFSAPVRIDSIVLQARAVNPPGNLLRLLDSSEVVIASTPTVTSSNNAVTTTLNTPGATGTVFFLEEFDGSQNVRFRSSIVVNYAPAASSSGTNELSNGTFNANATGWTLGGACGDVRWV